MEEQDEFNFSKEEPDGDKIAEIDKNNTAITLFCGHCKRPAFLLQRLTDLHEFYKDK